MKSNTAIRSLKSVGILAIVAGAVILTTLAINKTQCAHNIQVTKMTRGTIIALGIGALPFIFALILLVPGQSETDG